MNKKLNNAVSARDAKRPTTDAAAGRTITVHKNDICNRKYTDSILTETLCFSP